MKVKPLNWIADPDNDGDDGFFRAKAGVFVYEVGSRNSWWWQEDGAVGGYAIEGFKTPEDAKAAAQADYDSRILSALECEGGKTALDGLVGLLMTAKTIIGHVAHQPRHAESAMGQKAREWRSQFEALTKA